MRAIILTLLILAACSPTARVIQDLNNCPEDSYFQILPEGTCYDSMGIRVSLENGPDQDIPSALFLIRGDAGTTEITKDIRLNKGFAATVKLEKQEGIATPSSIAVIPIIDGKECTANLRTSTLKPC